MSAPAPPRSRCQTAASAGAENGAEEILGKKDLALFARRCAGTSGGKPHETCGDGAFGGITFEGKIGTRIDAGPEAHDGGKTDKMAGTARFKIKAAYVEDVCCPPNRDPTRDRIAGPRRGARRGPRHQGFEHAGVRRRPQGRDGKGYRGWLRCPYGGKSASPSIEGRCCSCRTPVLTRCSTPPHHVIDSSTNLDANHCLQNCPKAITEPYKEQSRISASPHWARLLSPTAFASSGVTVLLGTSSNGHRLLSRAGAKNRTEVVMNRCPSGPIRKNEERRHTPGRDGKRADDEHEQHSEGRKTVKPRVNRSAASKQADVSPVSHLAHSG